MTTQKRKIQEMSPTSAAVALEDPPAGTAEGVEESNGNNSADEQSAVAAGPHVTESPVPTPVQAPVLAPEPTNEPATAPATMPDINADQPADDLPREELPSETGETDAPAESGDQDGVAEPSELAAPAALEASGTLTVLAERISALEEAFALQQQAIADVGARVTDDLADIAGSIALEVERVTTDELVDAKRNLSLAAHSMAHLALGITESADNVTAELGPDSIIALLISFRAEVDNVLLQLGYAPLDTRVGEKFDPNRHRALRRIPTDDMPMDRLIARVIRDGYRSENTKRILVYSDVEVHRYQS
jgi:molecular chaperone GrpE (heat shock protein)